MLDTILKEIVAGTLGLIVMILILGTPGLYLMKIIHDEKKYDQGVSYIVSSYLKLWLCRVTMFIQSMGILYLEIHTVRGLIDRADPGLHRVLLALGITAGSITFNFLDYKILSKLINKRFISKRSSNKINMENQHKQDKAA